MRGWSVKEEFEMQWNSGQPKSNAFYYRISDEDLAAVQDRVRVLRVGETRWGRLTTTTLRVVLLERFEKIEEGAL